jgi:transcriptional regulator with PAS, ATPase and Fis domain
MVCRPREEWAAEFAPQLAYYETATLEVALEVAARKLKQAERKLRAHEQQLAPFSAEVETAGLTVKSPAMDKVIELAQRVARVDSTVLISGESGVGKERIAHFIHDRSERSVRGFVAINCGALPEQLLESELFGHTKGSFTGATQDRPGLFEEATGGTLFLDEIGEVSHAMQVKLLRVLQEREIRRIGENKNRPVDVRVLAATNRNLSEEVKAGRFRQDLYYRLRVIELTIPPLRERPEDILPLARVFLAATAKRTKTDITAFTPAAAEQLQRHSWPGNVRELENAIERAVVMATGPRIDVDDLPAELVQSAATGWVPGDERSLADVEKSYILAVLKAHDGNRTKAAAQLKIGLATLYRKLAEYGVTS